MHWNELFEILRSILLPGHIRIISYSDMRQNIGCVFMNNHMNGIHKCSELQVTNVEAPLERNKLITSF